VNRNPRIESATGATRPPALGTLRARLIQGSTVRALHSTIVRTLRVRMRTIEALASGASSLPFAAFDLAVAGH